MIPRTPVVPVINPLITPSCYRPPWAWRGLLRQVWVFRRDSLLAVYVHHFYACALSPVIVPSQWLAFT